MFDYVIIGGGSAGCVLAARLSEDPATKVCLLEAGPADKSALIHFPVGLGPLLHFGWFNWAFDTIPQAGLLGRTGYQPRGKVLGGSSSINAMVYSRGDRSDYDRWAAQDNVGWAYDDVLPYFKKSEHNERLADDPGHGAGGPLNVADLRSPNRYSAAFVAAGQQAGHPLNSDFNGARLDGMGLFQVTQKNGERCSAAKAYLTPNLGRPNLKVITKAHCTRILFEGKRAVGVEYRHGGRLKQVKVEREVLLSAGTLQSPQLLMLSGVGPAAHLRQNGIACVHDLPGVGRNLQDHLDVPLIYEAPHLPDLLGVSPGGAWHMIKGVMEWCKHRTGILTSNIAEAGGFLKSQPDETIPDLQIALTIAKLADHGRRLPWSNGYTAHVVLLRPKSRGSVMLASADPFAAPRIDPNFLAERDDVDRLVRGVRLLRQVMQQPALANHGGKEHADSARASTETDIEKFIRTHADTIYHPVGTCRMGSGPMDVVDQELRIHGVEGLRVVDASVMPEIVSGPPNAVVMMIGEKAAEMIKSASGSPRA